MDRKCIFITGAASGIGRETARLFAKNGWFVGLTDVNEEGLLSLQTEIGPGKCFRKTMDVTDLDSVCRTMEHFIEATGGRMDVLFNNAGIIKFGPFDQSDIAYLKRIVDINLTGVLNCTHCAVKYLKATPGARLINMASASVIYGMPDMAVYSATKHAVRALTEAWDIEFKIYGITVSDITAPYVRTPLLDVPEKVHSIDKFGVTSEPEDVAKTVWKAAHGKKLHWKVGASTPVMMTLFSLLPFLQRTIIKFIMIPPERR